MSTWTSWTVGFVWAGSGGAGLSVLLLRVPLMNLALIAAVASMVVAIISAIILAVRQQETHDRNADCALPEWWLAALPFC